MMDMSKIFETAQQMTGNLEEMKAKAAQLRAVGQAGTAPADVKYVGRGNRVIERCVYGDGFKDLPVDEQERLHVRAVNDLKEKIDQGIMDLLKETMGGMPLPPGVQLPF